MYAISARPLTPVCIATIRDLHHAAALLVLDSVGRSVLCAWHGMTVTIPLPYVPFFTCA